MRWGRIVLAAIAVTIFGTLLGMLTCGWLFKWVYLLPPVEVWNPEGTYTSTFWTIFNVGSFILAFLLATVYGAIYKGLPGTCRCTKGLLFGLFVWMVGTLPGMFALYMFTTIAPTVVYYWALSGLVTLLVEGLIIAGIYGKA